MLEDRCEGDDAGPGAAQAIIDPVVVRGIGRAEGRESAVRLRRVQTEARFLAVRCGPFALAVIQIQRPEIRLGVGQHVFHRRELDQMSRVAGAKGEALSTVHDGASHAEGDGGDPVFRGHGIHGIKIAGARDAGEIRIKTMPV